MEFKRKFPWESEEYLFRTDPDDYVEVEGRTKYNGSNLHKLLKKIEYQVDGEWKPYPSAVWVDKGEELYVAFFVVDGDGGVGMLSSPNGVPDGKLMSNADAAGILTKEYD